MRWLWPPLICLGFTACSDRYGGHPPYPATGQVLVNGQPAGGAQVLFYHLENWGDKSIVPQGRTDEDGRFVLSTYAVRDGAPAGEYRVAIEWPAYRIGKRVGPDRLSGKFSKPNTSGLTAHVEPRDNELPPLQLQGKVLDIKTPDASGRKRSRREDHQR